MLENIIKAYDALFEDQYMDPSTLTDEQIDQVLSLQGEMVNMLPALLVAKKSYAEVKRVNTKREELTDVFIKRVMKRLSLTEFVADEGKIKLQPYIKHEYDMTKLPEKYKQVSATAISSALQKWEVIPGVTALETTFSVRVS